VILCEADRVSAVQRSETWTGEQADRSRSAPPHEPPAGKAASLPMLRRQISLHLSSVRFTRLAGDREVDRVQWRMPQESVPNGLAQVGTEQRIVRPDQQGRRPEPVVALVKGRGWRSSDGGKAECMGVLQGKGLFSK
jgi:hypothetical protein